MSASRTPSETRTPRMEPLARLPVFFGLADKRAVVAGGSAAAAWKAELLSAAGARVEVFAPEGSDELRAITEDAEAATFAAAARAAGVPVNVIDKPAFSDFSFGSIVNRSPLVIGISTDGAAPVFAQAIRAKLEALLPQGFARWAAAARRWRQRVQSSGLSFAGRRRFWQVFTAKAVTHPQDEPAAGDFDALMTA